MKKLLEKNGIEKGILSDMVDRGVNKNQIIEAIGWAIKRRENDIKFLKELKEKLENE